MFGSEEIWLVIAAFVLAAGLTATGLPTRMALVVCGGARTVRGFVHPDPCPPRGKIPAEVARRAKQFGKPVIALAGTIGRGARATHDVGIDAYAGILAAPVSLSEAIEHADELVADATEWALWLVLVGSALAA